MSSFPPCKGSVSGDNGGPQIDAVMTAFQAYDSILFDDTIPASAKLQLLAYLRHSDRSFRGARPGAGVLMKACSTTRRQTIYSNANKLEREKRIAVRRFPGCSSHVDINVERLWTIAESIAFENPKLAKRFSWASTSALNDTSQSRTSTPNAPETSTQSVTGPPKASAPRAPDPCAESTSTRALRVHKRDNNEYRNVDKKDSATASPTRAHDPFNLNPQAQHLPIIKGPDGFPRLVNGAEPDWLAKFPDEGELSDALLEAGGNVGTDDPVMYCKSVTKELVRLSRLRREREKDRLAKTKGPSKSDRIKAESASWLAENMPPRGI